MKNIVTVTLDAVNLGVNQLDDGNYEVFGPNKKSYVGDRRMAAKKLGDFIFDKVDRQERARSLHPNEKPLEEAIVPYLERWRALVEEKGEHVLNYGPQPCACMGPQGDNPLCSCAMNSKARRMVATEKGYNLPPEG